MAAMATLQQAESLAHEYRFIDGKGRVRWIHDQCGVWPPTRTGPSNSSVRGDVTAAKLAEQLRETRVAVLDGVMSTRPSMRFCMMSPERLERIRPDMRVSILLLDPRSGRLHTAAAPNLPAFFNEGR